jgi:hypothetical protein
MSMKPRSTVEALLAVTETLLAARAARSARVKQTSPVVPRSEKVAKFRGESRPVLLRLKPQAIS